MKRELIGYPLGHSFSKPIHEFLTGLPYELHELKPELLDEYLKAKEFDGINVTIPYKEKVIPYLNIIDDKAKAIGAVNCIVNDHGCLIGHNTDADGFKYSILKHGVDLNNKTIAILGAGGASKAIKAVVNEFNYKKIYQTEMALKDDLITTEMLYEHKDEIEVVINCTPVGMYPNVDRSAIDIKEFRNVEWVIDVVYNPLKTKLLLDAEKLGIKTLGGIEMLVAQAYIAAEYFNGSKIDEAKVEKCLADIINSKRNIVLIGMPSCGKTTVAEKLSSVLSMPVADMDSEIVKREGIEIKEIFKNKGEEYFREIENQLSYEFGLMNGKIISTGGGIIKNELNITNLKRNGLIVYLLRDFDKLVATDDRPLSSNIDDLKKVYEERKSIYPEYADITIENNGELADTVNSILKAIRGE